MTLTKMITRIRQRSRTGEDFVPAAVIVDRINEAMTQLSKDMGGLVKEAYLALTPKFDLSTHHAFNITIVGGTNALVATDIPVTDVSVNDQTGAETATELQERIRAAGPTTLTVAWSASTYKFTIDGDDCTSMTIAAPVGANYADVTDLLFAKTGTETALTWVSNIPQDCMLEVDLPSDFLRIKAVEWDRNPLSPAPFDLFVSPQASGVPCYYQIMNKKMRVNAIPTSQKLFHLFYKYLPATITPAYQECGLSSKTTATETGLAATTQYYFKITIDGGAETEYDITTGARTTFAPVIVLLNAEALGCTFTITGGDLRCTSSAGGPESSIALAAGTTGTDLFVTLTGWAAFDTAYSELQDEIAIEAEIEDAIIFYATALLYEDAADLAKANYFRARYVVAKNEYKQQLGNQNPKFRTYTKGTIRKDYRVIV